MYLYTVWMYLSIYYIICGLTHNNNSRDNNINTNLIIILFQYLKSLFVVISKIIITVNS